jgi:serine/threonine-protein kinase RsbW
MDVTAGTVRLSFPASAIHVRTARLVAVTVARRTGWSEDLVESVRQGVGEACALALAGATRQDVLTLEMDLGDPGSDADLVARVGPVDADALSAAGALPRDVLAGLTDDAVIVGDAEHQVLRLTWTAPA